jgi:hypothetical protein
MVLFESMFLLFVLCSDLVSILPVIQGVSCGRGKNIVVILSDSENIHTEESFLRSCTQTVNASCIGTAVRMQSTYLFVSLERWDERERIASDVF